jgi:Ca2+-binding EF-hand superfamily protein
MADRKLSLDPNCPADKRILDELFLCYDPKGDGSGSLSYKEFSRLLRELGLKLTKDEIRGMMHQLDDNGNGLVEMDEFAHFFNHATIRTDMKENAENMRGSKNTYVRKMFDEFGNSRRGGLDLEGLKLVVKAARLDQGENAVTPKQVEQFFQRCDIDGTGFINVLQLQFIFDNIRAYENLRESIQNTGLNNEFMLHEVFDKFDSSLKGEMNKFDLLAAVQFLGYNITESGVDTLLAKIDEDNNGSVELDEFTTFFEQVQGEEQLIEELEDFKKKQIREGYVRFGQCVLGAAMILGGIYWSEFNSEVESDSPTLAYAYAAMFIGSVLIALVLLPGFVAGVYRVFVHVCCKTFNPTKAILVNFLILLPIAVLALQEQLGLSDADSWRGDVLRGLIALLLLVCVAEAAWLVAAYNGWLQPPPEVDEEVKGVFVAQLEDLERGSPKRAFEEKVPTQVAAAA